MAKGSLVALYIAFIFAIHAPLAQSAGFATPVPKARTAAAASSTPAPAPATRPPTACLITYNDLNGNGHRDPGEPSEPHLSQWGVGYEFQQSNALVPGDCWLWPPTGNHIVTEWARERGWVNTEPGSGTDTASLPATIATAPPVYLTFGWHYNGPEICIFAYNDLNSNGQWFANEPVLAGRTYALFDSNNTPVGNVTTGADGRACFQHVIKGTYSVVESPSGGSLRNIQPGGLMPHYANLVIDLPAQTLDVTFGYHEDPPQPGAICVFKYEDANGNHSKDSQEHWLSGWTFTIGSVSMVTDRNGRACFASLPAGLQVVTETSQPGWASTDPGGDRPSKRVVLKPGETQDVYFGNRRLKPNTDTAPPARSSQH